MSLAPIRLAALALGLATFAATASHWLAGSVWACDLIEFFRPGALLAALLCLGLALWGRSLPLAGVAAVLALANLYLTLAPAQALAAPRAAEGPGGFTLVTFNGASNEGDPPQLVAWAEKTRPDLIAVEEFSGPAWSQASRDLGPLYPYRSTTFSGSGVGLELFSRWPVVGASLYRPTSGANGTAVLARVRIGEREALVFLVHPDTPRRPGRWRDRNTYLQLAAQWIVSNGLKGGVIVAGDFNTPLWSPFYGDFLRATGLLHANANGWPPATRIFPHTIWPTWIGSPIDHVAVSPDVRVIGCRNGPPLGSDHLPVICRLRL